MNDIAKLFSLEGRVGLVTGAAGHLGSAMSRALASAGAHVVLVGRDGERLEGLAAEVLESGGSAEVAAFDMRDSQALGATIDRLGKAHGRLDFVVNNAYGGRTATLEQASAEDFTAAFEIAVTAPFELVQAALPLMRAAVEASGGTASVVNIASMYGLVSPDPRIYGTSGQNSPPFYAAAKGSLVQLTRYLACHMGAEKIRANCISPGPFPRPSVSTENPAFAEKLVDKVPMRRLGTPEDLAGAVVYLTSEASAFVNGANLVVDGGWTAW